MASRVLAGLGVIATTTLAVIAAQPWGANYAYQDVSGYLLLVVSVAWATSPSVYLLLLAGRQSSHRMSNFIRTAVMVLICLGGVAVVFDAVFVHPDAQSGLVFLFLPFYQWAIIGLLELVLALVGHRHAT